MKDFGKEVGDVLTEAGCWFLRHGRGDDDIPRVERPFTVSVKIKSRHMANKILKDAGLRNAF